MHTPIKRKRPTRASCERAHACSFRRARAHQAPLHCAVNAASKAQHSLPLVAARHPGRFYRRCHGASQCYWRSLRSCNARAGMAVQAAATRPQYCALSPWPLHCSTCPQLTAAPPLALPAFRGPQGRRCALRRPGQQTPR